METTLHYGKLTSECKTMVTEAMDAHIAKLARRAQCQPSELVREAIYMAFSGESYSGHVSNDRLSVMHLQGAVQGDKGATE